MSVRRKSKRTVSKVFLPKKTNPENTFQPKEWTSSRPKPNVDHFVWGEEHVDEIAAYIDWHGRHPHCTTPRERNAKVHGSLLEDEDNPNFIYTKSEQVPDVLDPSELIPFQFRAKPNGANGEFAEVAQVALDQERRETILNSHHNKAMFYQTSVKDNLDLYHIDGTYTIKKHKPSLRKVVGSAQRNSENGFDDNKNDNTDIYDRIYSKENIEIINNLALDPVNWKGKQKEKKGPFEPAHEWSKFTKKGLALEDFKQARLKTQLDSAMKKFSGNQSEGEGGEVAPEEKESPPPSLLARMSNQISSQLSSLISRIAPKNKHPPPPPPPLPSPDLDKSNSKLSEPIPFSLPPPPPAVFGFSIPSAFSRARIHPSVSLSEGTESTALEGSSWSLSQHSQTLSLSLHDETSLQTSNTRSQPLSSSMTGEKSSPSRSSVKSAWVPTPSDPSLPVESVQTFDPDSFPEGPMDIHPEKSLSSLESHSVFGSMASWGKGWTWASASQDSIGRLDSSLHSSATTLAPTSQISHRKLSDASDSSEVTEGSGLSLPAIQTTLRALAGSPQFMAIKPAKKTRKERADGPVVIKEEPIEEIRDIDGSRWSSDPSRAISKRLGGPTNLKKIAKGFENYSKTVRTQSVGLKSSRGTGSDNLVAFDLLDACHQGNYISVLSLLVSGESPNLVVADDNLFLYMFKFVNKMDVDINSLDIGALEPRERVNFTKILSMLIKYKAEVNYLSKKDGFGAIHMAALRGNAKLVAWFLDQANGNRDLVSLYGGAAAIHLAAKYGHLNVLTELLKRGSFIDQVDGAGWTALHHAAEQGHTNVAQFLLEVGATKRLKNKEGKTAAQLAEQSGFRITSQSILQHCLMPDQSGPLLDYMAKRMEPPEHSHLSSLMSGMQGTIGAGMNLFGAASLEINTLIRGNRKNGVDFDSTTRNEDESSF